MTNGNDWRALYPFESRYFELGSVRMHYVDEGVGGPTVLLVHGNPTWSFYWRELILALRGGYRVLAVDHIGCGLSDKPESRTYTLEQRIVDLRRLVESLDLRDVTLVAHDWGGAVGLGTALRCPQRFGRLVLLNTGAFPPPYVPFRIRLCRLPWLGTWAIRRWNLFARAALFMATERPRHFKGPVRQGFLAPYDNWQHRVAIDRFVKDIPFTRAHPTWQTLQSIEDGLVTLANRPTCLIWGMKDWCFTPRCLDRLLVHFPDARVHRIEDAGHYVLEDATDRVVQFVGEFLAQTSPVTIAEPHAPR